MKKCLVSLVSDQTIPNILITSSLRPDYLLLISTASMEKKNKSQAILDCLSILQMDYLKRSNRIIVPENSIPDFYEKVIEWIKVNRRRYKFIVNLTGGTKLMSLAAYEIFKNYGAEMIYMPIPKNTFFPVHRPNDCVPILTKLSVVAYLSAYGVTISNQNNLEQLKRTAHSKRDTTYFLFENYKELEPFLQKIGGKIRSLKKKQAKKGYDFSFSYEIKKPIEKKLLDRLGFLYTDGLASKKIDAFDWNYLRGGWLEDRIFLALESILPKDASDICMGVNCKIRGNDNEFDVLFTYNNTLYVVECKSLRAPEGGDKIEMGGDNQRLPL